MIPFITYNKDYVVNKPLETLEKKFSEIERNPSKFYNEINGKLLNASLKKYRFFVPVQGWMVFGLPVTFSRTAMTVKLFKQNSKTKIEVSIKTNPLYLLLFILTVTGLIVNFIKSRSILMSQGIIIYIVCIVAAVIIDRISKKILQGTFERFLK